ncbi:tetraacyldisaccharide 4'-kinase [Hydrogenovibrio sp. SC-1]|uniref:Trm112 family protein n=1 Tax=Hydrogenovibrio sp. SC-1 TaxID=2065820 RepID=UPI000C7AF9B7|nr:Trm112 family protein [Hydrogenovibrio sp. SC-1]PLA73598.1 tetraacyldisaccharide 4'-kinase [Hydrogenovibrio sp. SC-1]
MDPKLLDILVCPVTKTTLQFDKTKQELISTAANLAYPVRDGIPIMLEDEARALTAEEKEQYLRQKR